MTADIQEIHAFLARHPIASERSPEIRKAGIIPYLPDPLRYYVMTPVANKPDLGVPDFQICKGTRMFLHHDQWQDMRGHVPDDAPLEPLPETALREGIEELGLKLSNIALLQLLGNFHFTSATNGKGVALWLLAAKLQSPEDFLPYEAIAQSTQACAWYTLEEFSRYGRPDHVHILRQVEERLSSCA